MGVGERLTRGRWWGQKAAKWMEHALPRVLGRKDNVFHHECTCIENIRMPKFRILRMQMQGCCRTMLRITMMLFHLISQGKSWTSKSNPVEEALQKQ
uniref:Uncharacterized protein n=1 Tax=Oryza barthii TaxID=65489 RepID=A0A0D3HLM9_9ORYZ